MPDLAETNPLSARLAEGWSVLKTFLLPGKAEDDPGFEREIRRRATRGVYIIAGVTGLMPLLGLVSHMLANFFEPEPLPAPTGTLLLLMTAGAALAAARTSWGRRHARALGFALGLAVATLLTWDNLLEEPSSTAPVLESLVDLFVVFIVALAAIPSPPLQMFAFGGSSILINFGLAAFASEQGVIAAPSLHYYAGGALVVLLCGVLAGLNYQLLVGSYLANQDRLISQSRLLHAETAVSFSRLSATLSHELNSPLGVLASSVDSLKAIRAKEASGQKLNRERMDRLRGELLHGIEKAVEKLSAVAGRIQRFTNLDRAEVAQVQMDTMLQDVAQIVCPEGGPEAAVALRLAELPLVTLKPQSVSNVFSRLIHNAARANADGRAVEVDATQKDGDIFVVVRDHGESLSDQELRGLFEPGFRTKGSRVGAANWGLFTARQAIREHGGDISAARADSGGTRITVRLPVDGALIKG